MREIRKESKVCCVSWSDLAAGKCFERSRNPGGGVLQFQVTGMIEWGQKFKPKKRPKKKRMPNFQAIKFPESIKINNVTVTNLQTVLNTQKKSLAKSSCLQKYLLKFSYPKKS